MKGLLTQLEGVAAAHRAKVARLNRLLDQVGCLAKGKRAGVGCVVEGVVKGKGRGRSWRGSGCSWREGQQRTGPRWRVSTGYWTRWDVIWEAREREGERGVSKQLLEQVGCSTGGS